MRPEQVAPSCTTRDDFRPKKLYETKQKKGILDSPRTIVQKKTRVKTKTDRMHVLRLNVLMLRSSKRCVCLHKFIILSTDTGPVHGISLFTHSKSLCAFIAWAADACCWSAEWQKRLLKHASEKELLTKKYVRGKAYCKDYRNIREYVSIEVA